MYHLIAHCTVYGRRSLEKDKSFHLCLSVPEYVTNEKLYTKKFVMMEKSIAYFTQVSTLQQYKG